MQHFRQRGLIRNFARSYNVGHSTILRLAT